MSLFLNNLKKLHKKKVIDIDQLTYLVFADAKIAFGITAPKLKKLVDLKYITGGKVNPTLYKELSDVKVKGTIAPIYTYDLSKEVVKYVCKRLCVKDGDIIAVPGNHKEPLTHTAETYLGGEHALAYPYLIFLFLFPGNGKSNRRWEKFFLGTAYDGVPLRIRSVSTARTFVKMSKKKDMGAFMLGTYRFIKANIRGEKAYITTIPKYLAQYDSWYDQALDDIKDADSIEALFSNGSVDTGTMNVVL